MKKITIKNIFIFSIGIYIIFPFIAGIIDLGHDRRGPLFYPRSYHETIYRLGYSMIRNERPMVPFRKRSWFYCVEGDPLDYSK